ncbi:uncharacterized protein LOC131598482 [Vicia villosa]|uniref:uncharacterized protein LOC131598482 n=1 Tax=Vicia villosa TaxID=3911 RepID=UPI00273B418B|nr:uncharacterized protein LOC131598482 [Vicia villosa]
MDVEPKRTELDCFVWPLNGSEVYTVKDYYNLLIMENSEGVEDSRSKEAWAMVWKSWMPSKVKKIAWRLLKDRLATRAQLAKRGIIADANDCLCVFGCNVLEDRKHLFISCFLAAGVWRKIHQWLGSDCQLKPDCCDDFMQLVGVLHRRASPRRVGVIWVSVCWCIWKHRNEIVFNNGVCDVEEIIHNVKMHSWWWLAIGSKKKVNCNFFEWFQCPLEYL